MGQPKSPSSLFEKARKRGSSVIRQLGLSLLRPLAQLGSSASALLIGEHQKNPEDSALEDSALAQQHPKYRFHVVKADQAYADLSDAEKKTTNTTAQALQLLEHLALDAGIRAIMERYQLQVGELCELPAREDWERRAALANTTRMNVHRARYNRNRGENIFLHLRSDNG